MTHNPPATNKVTIKAYRPYPPTPPHHASEPWPQDLPGILSLFITHLLNALLFLSSTTFLILICLCISRIHARNFDTDDGGHALLITGSVLSVLSFSWLVFLFRFEGEAGEGERRPSWVVSVGWAVSIVAPVLLGVLGVAVGLEWGVGWLGGTGWI